MSGAYRTVFFLPDPALDWRIPVAVVVRGREGLQVAVAPNLPDDACLGGHSSAALLRMGLGSLRTTESFDLLPAAMGPHFVAEQPRELAAEADDPLRWAVENLLPGRAALTVKKSRGAQRATIGYSVFKRAGVDRFVFHKFRPKTNLPRLNGTTRNLHTVSHWVPGSNRLLLLEPIIPTRSDFEKEAADVAVDFLAYRHSFVEQARREKIETHLFVYITGQGNKKQRSTVREIMHGAAHDVFDVADESQRLRLTETIREVGKTAPPQGELFEYESSGLEARLRSSPT